jgi:NADH:ubiquinone oxidoreductase subunit F (NADH-binding)
MAIAAAEEQGLLGENILGTGFTFRARVKEGAGAFVCGEETALLASIEGLRGMPRPKPPFRRPRACTANPTVINNVETLGNLPDILAKGAAWFRGLGTEKSPGTKTFALTARCRTPASWDPHGIHVREVIFDIGRRHPQTPRLQGRADRRPLGRLPA